MDANNILKINDIKALIPHRPPFLYVDRVSDIVPGKSGTGIKCVTINESYFQGHFPEEPIVPGVLIVESMAQTAAVVLAAENSGDDAGSTNADKPKYFAVVKNIKFRRPVTPGDKMFIDIEVVKKFGALVSVDAQVRVDDNIVADGNLTLSG